MPLNSSGRRRERTTGRRSGTVFHPPAAQRLKCGEIVVGTTDDGDHRQAQFCQLLRLLDRVVGGRPVLDRCRVFDVRGVAADVGAWAARISALRG